MPARLGDSGAEIPVVEVRVPAGFKPLYPERISMYEGWERPGDPLELTLDAYTSTSGGWIGAPRAPDICSRARIHGENPDATVKRLVREQGDGFELAMCEFEVARPDGSRGPEGYLVRKWIQVGRAWLECKAVMRGRKTGPDGRWYDASSWTERQKSEVLDICRSFRVVRTEPAVRYPGLPFQPAP